MDKLAKPSIPAYTASGKRYMIDSRAFRLLREAHRFARVIRRKRDQAATRAYLLASPNEIASRITAPPTVVKVLPQTWTHRPSLAQGF